MSTERHTVMIKGNDICNTSSTVSGKLFLPGNASSDESLWVKDFCPDHG